MKKHLIKDSDSLREYMRKIKNPVFGIGTRPYNYTIGAHLLFTNFEILACKRIGLEKKLIEKKIKTTYLEKSDAANRTIKNYKTYRKKTPVDLFRSKKIIAYLNSFKYRPVLLFNRMPRELEVALRGKKYIIVSSGFRMFHKYENKLHFQKLLDRLHIDSPKNIVLPGADLDFDKIIKLVGKKFVVQLPESAMGAGTFFIFKRSDFENILKNPIIQEAVKNAVNFKITRYINQASSPSMTVCVTNFGILYTGLQKQIIDAREVIDKNRRSGIFCGHDWTSSWFAPEIEKQAFCIAEKIGRHFKEKEKFRGIFGLDFVLEKNTKHLYPIEANIRLLGSFPVLSMAQLGAEQPLIQGIQILDRLNRNDYRLNIRSLNQLMARPKKGSHLNVYLRNFDMAIVSKNIKPGIYRIDLKTKRIVFLREGIFFEDLKTSNEILLAGGVPCKDQVYERGSLLCKLISCGSFLGKKGELNTFSRLMVAYVYKKLALKKLPSL